MENQKETANKGRRKMIIIAFVVLCAALVVCVVLLLQKTKPKELDRGFVDESNKDTVMEDMGDKVAEGMFECKMTTSWVFEDGKSESPNAYVANVENNLEKVLQKGEYDAVVMYTLVDEDNEEVSTVGFDITISVNN